MPAVGADLIAQSTVTHRGNLIYNNIRWPQRADELKKIGKLVVAEGVRSYLEIGLQNGFTLRYLGGLLPPPSRITGVDEGYDNERIVSQRAAAGLLCEAGHEAYVITGNSTDTETIERVRGLGPYDFVLIDGDHTMQGVRADWNNYGPMGRIVAFHDIDADKCDERKPRVRAAFGVQKFWHELKQQFRHIEIIGKSKGAGFGVLWRA